MYHHPYQIARVCNSAPFEPYGLLLAACGGRIISVKLADGSILSQWPDQNASKPDEPASEGPPGKKRKLEQDSAPLPNVLKLAVSPDYRYAVAVTDDKAVRVLEVTSEGKLIELSQRTMPKRPCAVLVTPDNQTILCGDKFGDVYSLPLIPSLDAEKDYEPTQPETKEDIAPKQYIPTATTLTVHTGRNRKALENQMRQKDLQAKAKEGPKFEHQLLLGHVSMLTDVAFATEEVDGKTRGYIVTADRDEHIRISRGPPQAHVIERFCLGHTEFISKVCLLAEDATLVSGGGDDWLGFWDWRTGNLQHKCDMRSALTNLLTSQQEGTGFGDDSQIAVSGIWAVPAISGDNGQQKSERAILVAFEKFPALLVAPQDQVSSATPHISGAQLSGNPLDVTVLGERILVSMDVAEGSMPRLQAFSVHMTEKEVKLVADDEINAKLQAINEFATPAPERKQLDDLLYGVENLRKRGTDEGQDVA